MYWILTITAEVIMPQLKIYIPDSEFEPGGRFEKYANNRTRVQVLLVGTLPVTKVTVNPVFIEEYQYQPVTNRAYNADLGLLRSGAIVIEKNGTPIAPEDLTTIFKTYFQEL